MTIVFRDTFDHGTNDDDLVGTVPDTTGTSWLAIFNDSGTVLVLKQPDTNAWPKNSFANGGILVHANYGTVGSASIDIELTLEFTGTDDHGSWIVARYIDGSNYIALHLAGGTSKVRLYKVVSGTVTLLATSTNNVPFGATVKLQLRGSKWKAFIAGSEEISVTETDLALKGKSCVGMGDIEDDFSGFIVDNTNRWEEIIINEYIHGTLDGVIAQLTGNINGFLLPEGPLVGVIEQLTGIINGVTKAVGTLDGIISQLDGSMIGVFSELVTGTLNGNIDQLSGNIIGLIVPEGIIAGNIDQLLGAIIGFGDVVLINVNLSIVPSEVIDTRLTWFDTSPVSSTWTFKPIIKPS